MPSLNNLSIIGHAGRDGELKYTANGKALYSFSVAVSRSYKSGDEWKEETDWFNVTLFGDQAERQANYDLKKGNLIYVEGRVSMRTYESNGVQRSSLDVAANRVLNLTKREEGATPAQPRQARPPEPSIDDLPFE